ncbi:MAG: invasion associated locus B family protein [Alphaproteobacteria bacterium]
MKSHSTGQRRTRRLRPFLALLGLAVLLPLGARAVPYVVYYRIFGEWSVVCWRGLVAGDKSCYIDAPAIAFNESPHSSSIRLTEDQAGTPVITVFSRSGTARGASVALTVDGAVAAQADPDALDRASWRSPETEALIARLRAGHGLGIELFDSRGRLIGDKTISLAQFADAFDDYRAALARLSGAPPENPPESQPGGPRDGQPGSAAPAP